MAFNQLQQDVEPFLGRQARIELIVSLVRIVETAKHLNDAVHVMNLTM